MLIYSVSSNFHFLLHFLHKIRFYFKIPLESKAERKMANLLLLIPMFVEAMPKKMWLREMNYEFNLVIYYNPDKPEIAKQ